MSLHLLNLLHAQQLHLLEPVDDMQYAGEA